jgi:eukaryotic-like serine/threonine-protein kinase
VRPLGAGRTLAPGVTVRRHLNRSNALDVYEAWCARRSCPVVVKVPRPDRLGDGRLRRDLLREGRLLVRLAHPNIVRGYEVHDGPRPAVVLEALGGETLGHLFDRLRRRLSAGELAHLGLHLGGALRYLHGEGLLHLDVKPSNAVAEAGRARLLDLSLAARPGPHRAGRGTWCNMAPEQARGGVVGPAADVFGLGTVLWEGATGDNPFADGVEDHPTLARRAVPVRTRRRLPADLAGLVDAMLDPDPGDRPALDEVLAGLSAAAPA